jgi:Flp pilus assembly protein protease CpaA
MLSSELSILIALLPVLVVAGVQDWRRGEVSNWITIPLFCLGVIAAMLRVFLSNDMLTGVMLFAMAVSTLAAFKGWMGGADWKVLVGLFGVYPIAGFAALIFAGIWGAVLMLKTKNRDARFPGVTAFVFAACLTVLGKVSIILLN